MSILSHFPLEPGCADYSFLDQVIAVFEQDLNSMCTNSFKTPELDASFGEPDNVILSVSLGLLCSGSTVSDISELQLAPRVKSLKLWHQAWEFLLSIPLASKMSAFKLICYFSGHPAAFGFRASPPDT